MRSQKIVKKFLAKMMDPKRTGSAFTKQEEWGIIYTLKWVLNLENQSMIMERDE